MEHFPDNTVPTIVRGFEAVMAVLVQVADAHTLMVLSSLRETPMQADHGHITKEEGQAIRDAAKCIDKLRLGRYLHEDRPAPNVRRGPGRLAP